MQHSEKSGGRVLHQQRALLAVAAAVALVAAYLPVHEVVIPPGLYLPLHTTLEFLAAAVALLVFATVWHTPPKEASTSLMWIATALLAAGWMDLAHALSFKGMPEFITAASVEKGIAFWLIARLLVAVTLLGVSLHPDTAPPVRAKRYAIIGLYSAINLVGFVMVMYFPHRLPATFVEGEGLTTFKVLVEVVIIVLLSVAAARYYVRARDHADEFARLIFGAAGFAALSELFFTWYQAPTDMQNMLGHVYKIVSYGLLYRAVFVAAVHRPYEQLAAQAERLVQANETLRIQALVLDATVAPVVVADVDGRIRWRNRASHEILPDERAGSDPLSLFGPPATPDPAVAASMRASLSAGKNWRGIVELVDRKGGGVIMSRVVTPVRNDKGEVDGFVSVSEDVTERERVRLRHQRVLDSAIDGFWIMDTQGRLLAANQAFARMTGYSVDELLSMNLGQLEAAESSVETRAHMEEIMRTGRQQFETRHRHKDGHEILVEISTTFDADLQQFFVFARDITERAQAAKAQQDLERQLQQAQKMEALGQLTGGIAHDFNNILASVLGYSKLALDRLVPDKESKLASYLREVITASERARDLVAKMLTFTRTRSNPHSGPIASVDVIREVVAMVRPSIPATIQIDVRVEDDLKIRMDAGELNQVLVNLIINARDAIEAVGGSGLIGIRQRRVDGAGRICASCRQRLAGPYLAIEISDNGSGIAPEHMPRVFDPFFTTKDVGKGSGLGLPMVQGILRRSGGHVVVESQPGRGSVFQLMFPIIAAPTAGDVALQIDRPAPDGGRDQTIWVVDDEPAIARYVSELLEGNGYRVLVFHDPKEVLEAFSREGAAVPDLLVTDKTMPGMSGLELARHLCQARPNLPIILCTGYTSEEKEDALPSCIRKSLIKPVIEQDLLEVIAAEIDINSH